MLPDPLHNALPAIVRGAAIPVRRLAPEHDAVDALRYATSDLDAAIVRAKCGALGLPGDFAMGCHRPLGGVRT